MATGQRDAEYGSEGSPLLDSLGVRAVSAAQVEQRVLAKVGLLLQTQEDVLSELS